MNPEPNHNPVEFDDLLQETRVLLAGAQVLTAFLIILPFNASFSELIPAEKWVYVMTFLSSLASLILFSAPAVHHRLIWPVVNRERFKHFETRMLVIGLGPLSLALILATRLVMAEVIGSPWSWVFTVLVVVFLGVIWGMIPLIWRAREQRRA
jgi:hypothetical protein